MIKRGRAFFYGGSTRRIQAAIERWRVSLRNAAMLKGVREGRAYHIWTLLLERGFNDTHSCSVSLARHCSGRCRSPTLKMQARQGQRRRRTHQSGEAKHLI